MKIGTKSNKPVWLFPENITEITPLVLKDAKEYDAGNGKLKIPILVFNGTPNEIYVSQWKLVGLDKIVEVLGDDTDKWLGKHFNLSNVKGAIHIHLAEETV